MMRISRILCAAGVAVLLMAGCSISEKEELYDRPDRMLAQGDSFTFARRSQQSVGEYELRIEYSRFSGIQTLWTIETDETGEMVVEYGSRVSGGDFKVVAVTPDGEAVLVSEMGGQGSVAVVGGAGIYRIRMAGRNASGEIGLRLAPPQGALVTPQDND